MNRIRRTYGQSKRSERIEPSRKEFRSTLWEARNRGKRPGRESIRLFAVLKRVPLRAYILCFVVIAVVITSVSLFSHGNSSSNNTQQAMAVYQTRKDSTAQTSLAPVAASVSSNPSAPVSNSSGPSAAPASSAPSTAPAAAPSDSDSSSSDALGSMVFKAGMTDPLVALIQQRLMDLHYLADAPTTQLYGPLTQDAVTSFQRDAGLPADGSVGSRTYSIMMSENAPQNLGTKSSDKSDNEKESTQSSADQSSKKTSDDQSSAKPKVNLTSTITKKTNLKSTTLESIMPSALKGLGKTFANDEQEYGVNALFVLAIIDYESAYGTSNLAQHQNNLGGIKLPTGDYKTFSSKKECVNYMFDLLSSKYIDAGLTTIPAIGKVYCTGNTWATRIKEIMQDLIDECS